MATKNESKQLYSNLWYLDNVASNRMSGKKSKFHVLDEQITGRVKFGDGSTVEIKGINRYEIQGWSGTSS